HLHCGPADEQEDHAPPPAGAAHRRAEAVRRAPGRLRSPGPSARHGPHGDRSGDDHPDDDGGELPLRREHRRRRRLRPRLQRLGARLLLRRTRSPLPRGLAAAPERASHLPRARAHRGPGLPRGADPPDRCARPLSQLHLPEPHRRRADGDHGPRAAHLRGDRARARHAHLPRAEPRGGARDAAARPARADDRAGEMATGGRMVDVQTLSFIFEAATWLAQVLLSGMLDLYPRLRMAIFESNAGWLPQLLPHWDRLFTLYANERPLKSERLPSRAFAE